jgi:predicted nucleic acid-binding protein
VMVLDASVLIAHLDGTDDHHEAAEALLASAIEDDLGVNPLTLAEVLVGPARTGRLDTALSVVRDLDVETLLFPADTAIRLAQLRAGTDLKMPDCCVLLSAEDTGASVASFDASLVRAAETRGVPVLRS